MTNPAIIEAAARIIFGRERAVAWDWIGDDEEEGVTEDERGWHRNTATAVLAAVTPLIEANALERAAKVIEEDRYYSFLLREEIAAAIRALKEQP